MSELTLVSNQVSFSDFALDEEVVITTLLEIMDDISKQIVIKQTQIAVTTRTKHTGEERDLASHKGMLVQAVGSFQNEVRELMRTLNSIKWVYSQLVTPEVYAEHVMGDVPSGPELHLEPQPQILSAQDGVVGAQNPGPGIVSA